MKDATKNIYEELFVRYPALKLCENDIFGAFEILFDAYKNGKKLRCFQLTTHIMISDSPQEVSDENSHSGRGLPNQTI